MTLQSQLLSQDSQKSDSESFTEEVLEHFWYKRAPENDDELDLFLKEKNMTRRDVFDFHQAATKGEAFPNSPAEVFDFAVMFLEKRENYERIEKYAKRRF